MRLASLDLVRVSRRGERGVAGRSRKFSNCGDAEVGTLDQRDRGLQVVALLAVGATVSPWV